MGIIRIFQPAMEKRTDATRPRRAGLPVKFDETFQSFALGRDSKLRMDVFVVRHIALWFHDHFSDLGEKQTPRLMHAPVFIAQPHEKISVVACFFSTWAHKE
jgi:hypothetical protein